jgi:hypothetical protein
MLDLDTATVVSNKPLPDHLQLIAHGSLQAGKDIDDRPERLAGAAQHPRVSSRRTVFQRFCL